MDIAIALGVLAGLLHILVFALYNRQMLKGISQPNLATWILWVFLTVLNVSSYAVMSDDWVKSILPLASSIACILTFLFALYKGKLSKIDPWDGLALGIGIISSLVWWYYKSATYANLILQFSIAVSFVPTYRGVWNNSLKERALPWFMWSSAYILSIIVVILRWQSQYQDLVYPVNCLILHAVVGLLTKRHRNNIELQKRVL
ncbi:MAG: hypothetical protein U9M90_00685 [Patescibacteria group bacterium]|nr:hypothetical protein [Patescibacteria group bacterium]